jgi:aminoglycoside/choline kinase family phosphotransferase
VSACWPGARPKALRQLAGDASARRYWRVLIEAGDSKAPASVIAAHLGPHDLPRYARALKLLTEPLAEPLYLNVGRYLKALGVSVPEVYCATGVQPADPGNEVAGEACTLSIDKGRLILIEDVGEVSLIDAAKTHPARAPELFQAAIDELIRFHVDGTARPDSHCLAFSITYDERLFAWEMKEFLEEGLGAVNAQADRTAIAADVTGLAARLGGCSRVFSHRDYHGYNIFVQQGSRLRVLDFQDALLAPAAQDLAVMLTTRDTSTVVGPLLEAELLAYYVDQTRRRGGSDGGNLPDPVTFLEEYRLAVLQHALKAIGRFAQLVRMGRERYRSYLPFCLKQARRMLNESDDFPALREALCR